MDSTRQSDPHPRPEAAPADGPTLDHPASQRDPGATTDAVDGPTGAAGFPPLAGRCRIEGEIARGGMGVVLRAFDPSFGRRLAVKVLLARSDERADLARRFRDEARLTGRLQHPGIPPVHEQGELDDGRPYFTMKLIEGRTLDALLKERPSPLDDLPRFITIFGQLCQTVAYAHSQAVIHRDLKPLNVMVGAFGEVQVMDWGLAKVRGAAGPAEVEPPPAADDDAGRTRAGQALGTPAYMPPEQARGEVEDLDERADVFGLGAILCAVLTGLPPYQGKSAVEVMGQALQGDLADAWKRLDSCGADPELIALARACLQPEPPRRPRDAAEVAAAVARYQEGVQERLQKAEQERAAARVQAVEGRKRRRVLLVLAAVVLAGLTAGGAVWLWLSQQRATARAELTAALDASRQSMARGGVADAMSSARRAEGLLAAAGNDAGLRRDVDKRLKEIEFIAILEKIRTPENTAQERIASRSRADGLYGRAFRDLGIDVDVLDPAEAARRIEDRPALKPYLVAVLDDWVGPRRQARRDDPGALRRLLDVARRADPDPWRDRLRTAVAGADMDGLMDLAAGVDVRSQTPSALLALATGLMSGGRRKAAVNLLRRAEWEHPEDFWLPFYQGLWQGQDSDPNDIEQGARSFAVAVALRPKNVEAWSGYSVMLEKQGRIDEAVTAARRAAELEPDSCSANMALDAALATKGDLDGAHEARSRAVELLREQVRKDPGDDEAWVCLAINVERLGGPASVRKANREAALEANREAVRADPHNPWARHNIGALLRKDGKAAEALPWLEEAARLAPESAYILGTLGLARGDAGDDPGAEQAVRKAIELQPYYLPPYGTLADVLERRGDKAGSRDALHKGLRMCGDVLGKYPNCFRARFLSGYYLWKLGDLAGSAEQSRKAIEVYPSDADAYANLTVSLHDQGLLDQALETSRQGARRAEPSVLVFNDLAFDLTEKGESLDEADKAVRQALALDPESDVATLTQAEVFRAQGKFAESLEAYRRGDLLHAKKAVHKWPTGEWVKDAEKLVDLDRDLPRVLNGERPLTTAAANRDYGRLCGYKELNAAAARFYEAAFALDPKPADGREAAARCAALAGLGRGGDAPAGEEERAHLRRLALEWLRTDLGLWQMRTEGKGAGTRNAARQALNRWRTHDAFAGVRDAALEKLPEAERREWQRFWADVAALLDRLNDST
jgi:serine/threonine-protein kinase